MKNGRVSGPGGIPAELIKNDTPKLFRMLKIIFESCLNEEHMSQEWKVSWITPIRKEAPKDCSEVTV